MSSDLPEGTYAFPFDWVNSYGHTVKLLEQLEVAPGVVLDLGCGYGSIAEVLAERDFEYVGCDVDAHALADLEERGFAAHTLDLNDLGALPDRVGEIIGERPVAAVLMLDVLEHLPDASAFLDAFRPVAEAYGRPVFVLSVPNVAHFDLGAKLIMGRWEVTPTGLLDRTHLQFFTLPRLLDELARRGWREAAADDVLVYYTDQHVPRAHPALRDGVPLHDFLLYLRRGIDDTAGTQQFVRAFALGEPDPMEEPLAPDIAGTHPAPFLTAVLPPGAPAAWRREVIDCLGVQTDGSFEVLVLVDSLAPDGADEVHRQVADATRLEAAQVRVETLAGMSRAAALNAALDTVRGRYVAVLEPGYLVVPEWVEAFHSAAVAHEGAVLYSHDRDDHWFEHIELLRSMDWPMSSFALPIETVREFRLGFDEALAPVDGWALLLEVVSITGVADTGRTTTRRDRDAQAIAVPEVVRARMRRQLDARPVLLVPGEVRRLADLADEASRLKDENEEVRQQRDQARLRVQELEESTIWRSTQRLRDVVDKVRYR